MSDATWPGLDDQELGGLGPADLPMLRSERYRGTGQECSLARLDPSDRETVTVLYEHLRGIVEVWREEVTAPDWAEVARRTLALAESGLMGRVGALGATTADDGLQRILHDLRGGAATAVLAEAELLEPGLRSALDRGDVRSEGLGAVVLLARDHTKIMRNALPDLDPEERARDTVENPHRVDDLVERWKDVRYRTLDGLLRVRAERDAPGLLSSGCLGFGAVDRIAYNLINNAARHSADGEVALQVRHVEGDRVRIAVTNRVDPDHGRWLAGMLGDDPAALFRWGATRGREGIVPWTRPGDRAGPGAGLGLGIVAEFVASAFGVPTAGEALAGRYLGATLLGDRLVGDRLAVWFHWPAYPG